MQYRWFTVIYILVCSNMAMVVMDDPCVLLVVTEYLINSIIISLISLVNRISRG